MAQRAAATNVNAAIPNGQCACASPGRCGDRRWGRFAAGFGRRRGRRRFLGHRLPDDGSDESVTPTGHRFDEPRRIGRVPERIAQPPNGGIQPVLEIDECLCRPESLSQLVAGHELTRTVQQRLEKLKRLIGEADPDATLPKFARPHVELERAETDDRIEGSAHSKSDRSFDRQGMVPRPFISTRICLTTRHLRRYLDLRLILPAGH